MAALARLELDEAEETLFAVQLSRVLEYIDQLDRFEAVELPPATAAPVGSEDRPRPGLDSETVLANAPAAFGPFVVVPRVLGDDA